MVNVDVSISNFSQLHIEKQKEFLIVFLEGLKELDPIFVDLLTTIKSSKYIQAERFVSIYGEIMKFVSILESSQKEEIFANLKTHLIEMQKREAEEKAKDNEEINALIDTI